MNSMQQLVGILDRALQRGSAPDLQLPERLRKAGLDPEETSARYPGVMRDLERVCSVCAHKRSCARDLENGRDQSIKAYCPNSMTIEALSGG